MAVKYLAGNRLTGTDAERLALTTLGSAGWTEMDSSKISINTSTAKIDFNMVDGSIDNLYYPITVSSSKWALRFIVNFTSGASANTNTGNQYFRVGFADSGTQSGSSEPTNGATCQFQDHGSSSANEKWFMRGTGGSNIYGTTGSGTTTGVDYYVTFKRSATDPDDNLHFDIKTGSHSGTSLSGSTLVQNVGSSTGSFSHFYISNASSSGTVPNALSGTMRAIQIWQDTDDTDEDADFEPTFTNTYPNLPNGATFLTSDTNLLYMFDGVSAWNLVS